MLYFFPEGLRAFSTEGSEVTEVSQRKFKKKLCVVLCALSVLCADPRGSCNLRTRISIYKYRALVMS
jgi:hypothetical protein